MSLQLAFLLTFIAGGVSVWLLMRVSKESERERMAVINNKIRSIGGSIVSIDLIKRSRCPFSSEYQDPDFVYKFYKIDEWMIPLYGEHMEREVFDRRLATLKELFKSSAMQLFSLGVPVIFDFGFWRKTDRSSFIDWASNLGVESEMHYLDVPFEVCKQRATARNSELQGKSYEMTPEMLDLFWSWFEIPTPDEDVVWVHREITPEI